jgi:UDP-N-acetylglucosamine 2-epimerase
VGARPQFIKLAPVDRALHDHDRTMPEERNRVVADHLSDLLLAPTDVAAGNLAAEGLRDRAAVVGDIMVDALIAMRDKMAAAPGRYLPDDLPRGLITDSGGLQKEALLLGVACTTLRSRTEWPETLQDGWNVLVPDPGDLAAAVSRPRPAGPPPSPYGDGAAAGRVADCLGSWPVSGAAG